MVTVLGASGYIGDHIFRALEKSGVDVKGTYFKHRIEGFNFFDLETSSPEELDLEGKSRYLVISAALNATIDATKKNWEKTYYLNVVKIKSILEHCFLRGVIPIYISTDHVFDGKNGNYKEEDQRNPINCYGRIRYEVENYLLDSRKDFVILRMGKVFGTDFNDNTLISSLLRDLKAGQEVFCADDQVFTPLYINDLIDFVRIIIQKDVKGVFHLASLEPVSRYALAMAIKNHFHLEKARIKGCKINSLNLLELRPLLIDLNCAKYRQFTGLKQASLTACLKLFN